MIPPSNRKYCTLRVKRAMNYGLRFYPRRECFDLPDCWAVKGGMALTWLLLMIFIHFSVGDALERLRLWSSSLDFKQGKQAWEQTGSVLPDSFSQFHPHPPCANEMCTGHPAGCREHCLCGTDEEQAFADQPGWKSGMPSFSTSSSSATSSSSSSFLS